MLYCNVDDGKATVDWSWDGGKSFQQYTSKIVPIQVEVGAVSTSDVGTTGTWSMITFDQVTASSPFSYRGDASDSPVFNERTIISAKDGRVLYSDGSNSAGSIQARDIKFTSDSEGKYKITISSASGTKLYEEKRTSQSPPIFNVTCGDECPEGFCKCPSPGYPGYCCLDCKSVAGQIGEIVNDLKYRNLQNIPPPSLT